MQFRRLLPCCCGLLALRGVGKVGQASEADAPICRRQISMRLLGAGAGKPNSKKAAFGLLLLSTAVMAQPGGPPRGGRGQGSVDTMDARVQQRSMLTAQDMLNNGTAYRKKMSDVVTRIEDLLQKARKEKDIIRINCLVDKLVQVKASLNVTDKAFTMMKDAIDIQNQETAFYQYTRITLLNQNVQTVVNDADACVGADLSYIGTTRVDVEVEGVPEGDPTQDPQSPDLADTDRPPFVSPYF
jgi:hypothetical protein